MNGFNVVVCLAATLISPLATAGGFDGSASASSVTLTSDYTLRYRTLFPAGRGREFGTFVSGDAKGEHRIFFDTKTGLFYGYDVRLTRSGSAPGFLLTLGPFSPEAERQLRATWARLCPGCPDPRPVSSAGQHFPPPHVVVPGDKIVVDLLADEKSGAIVSEEIAVVSKEALPRESAARDFRVEDVEMQILEPALFVDGHAQCKDEKTGYVSGDVVWLKLPGHGRAFFSLVPHPGYAFEKIGAVAGNKLGATIDGTRYEWITRAPIVTPEAPPYVDVRTWNLWVLHDSGFEPARPGCLEEGGGLDGRLRSR
jgi:hypothetical protein